MDTPLKLQIIIGSTREGRFGDKAAQWIADIAKSDPNFQTEVVDLRDWPLPFYSEKASPTMLNGAFESELGKKWWAKIAEADAYIMVTPEYNHAPSAVLKNAIDWVGQPWNKKAVAFVSYGSVGGARAVDQLRPVVAEQQMASMRTVVHIMAPWMLLDGEGKLKPGVLDGYQESAQGMLQQLSWWGKVLRAARAQG